MPFLWHRGQGSRHPAAGLVAGLLFLACLPLFAGAKAPSPLRDDYDYAALLLEDLQAVPRYELGANQYRLVIEAFRKAHLKGEAVTHKEESLLAIGRLYEQLATSQFGEPSHREEALKAYRSLLGEFPDSARRAEVASLIRGLGGTAPEPINEAVDAGPLESGGTGAAQKPPRDGVPTPVTFGRDAAGSGAMPLKVGRASSRSGRLARVRQVRYWSHPECTRIIVELDRNVSYKSDRVEGPERVFFDFRGSRLDTALRQAAALEVNDPIVQRIRVGQNRQDVSRMVIDLTSRVAFSASWLPNPPRLAIELRTKRQSAPPELLGERGVPPSLQPRPAAPTLAPDTTTPTATTPTATTQGPAAPAATTLPTFEEAFRSLSEPSATLMPGAQPTVTEEVATPVEPAATEVESVHVGADARLPAVRSEPVPEPRDVDNLPPDAAGELMAAVTSEPIPAPWDIENLPPDAAGELRAAVELPEPPRRVFERYEPWFVNRPDTPPVRSALEPLDWTPVVGAAGDSGAAAGPVGYVLLPTGPMKVPPPAPEEQVVAKLTPPPEDARVPPAAELPPPTPAKATSRGQQNLIRALGLKLGRVVIDPGHGGRHTGSIGPTGLQEKNVVSDIAQRLGTLIEKQLGAEVVYTREDDRFVPLRQRTRMANGEKADLFVSIHVNAARQRSVRGIETYYLNFTTDAWAMKVASRENAAADRTVHELQDLLSKIVQTETITESREFAAKVQNSLYRGLAKDIEGLRNRGVRKAPLMVLIGAKMPAILVEVGFISNPRDEKLFKSSAHRQKVAEYIFSGISAYADTLSTFEVSQKKAQPAGDD